MVGLNKDERLATAFVELGEFSHMAYLINIMVNLIDAIVSTLIIQKEVKHYKINRV